MSKFKAVKAQVNFPEQEKKWLKYWQDNKVFEKSVRGDKNFSFYDGPPFATGLPHYGHLLAGVLKDVVPRYYTMNGYKVDRQFGWDCHGLPVEAEVQKKLNLYSQKDVLNYGVDKFNEECRSVVQRYTQEWKETVSRVGRWVDMEKPYLTMDVNYMQSVWWAFKELYNKGLVYEGYKVVPYSVGLGSVLSNFEANQNYKDTQDPALTLSFQVKEKPWKLLAWTTTPWTVPMNTALAVNPNLSYSLVSHNEELYVVATKLVSQVFKDLRYTEQEVFPGSDLVNLTYTPLFDFYSTHNFRVVSAEYVREDSGTGLVHLAPAFGEEDFYVAKKEKLPLFNPVDNDGLYTEELTWLQGKKALDSNKDLVKYLKDNKHVFKQEQYTHSYPYCYRTQTKLMYRAVSSWFVAVESFKEDLLKNNQTTQWHPEHLRDGRFGKWLEQTRDWAVSRNRFWGTPLPLWQNSEGETLCVGSKAELEALSGVQLSDLHSHHLAHLELKSPTGKGSLKWVGGVLDCWFESASMPFAKLGYPYVENSKEKFQEQYSADFVAEGLDQTRGWFYTLMVMGTALFDKAPYKNVMVNGLVLAEDGKKMSKLLKNYPDPMLLLERQGADALRLYLLDSAVVMGEDLKFSEKGVSDQLRKNLLRLHNVYSFFTNYAELDNYEAKDNLTSSTNLLDKWLLSRFNTLVKEVRTEVEAYRLNTVVAKLSVFVEDLTNTYVRMNRNLFWESGMSQEKTMAYNTLYYTLLSLSKLMAPFTPYMSEELYQNLSGELESVHLETYPVYQEELEDRNMEESVQAMVDLLELGRNYRDKVRVKNKVPLLSMSVVHRDEEVLKTLKNLEKFFKEALNVRVVEYSKDETSYVKWSVSPNYSVAGKKLGNKLNEFKGFVGALDEGAVFTFLKTGKLDFNGLDMTKEDVMVQRKNFLNKDEVCFNNSVVVVFNPYVGEEQLKEGEVRELMRKVQEMRKELDLPMKARVNLELKMSQEDQKFFLAFEEELKKDALVDVLTYTEDLKGDLLGEVNGVGLALSLV